MERNRVIVNGHSLKIIIEWSVGAKLHSSTNPDNDEGATMFFKGIFNAISLYVSMFGQLPSDNLYFTHSDIDVKINYMSFDYKNKSITFNLT